MVNLNVYTKYSGNEYAAAEECIMEEYKRGNQLLSVTDHNCAKGNAAARRTAEKCKIQYISGIEIDCTFCSRNISVLGYDIDDTSSDFVELDEKTDDLEYRASIDRLCETQAMGFQVTENDMWRLSKEQHHPGNWTGKMFAQAILTRQENRNHISVKKYLFENEMDSYRAFDRDFYSEGALCYVGIQYMALDNAIDLIHRNGGKAVVKFSTMRKFNSAQIEELVETDIDYIDCNGKWIVMKQLLRI